MKYDLDEYKTIIQKILFLSPYSDGITISGKDNVLLWDINYYIEINHNKIFTIELRDIKDFLKDISYIEYYDDIFFFKDKPLKKHNIEHDIIKSLVIKRFTQIDKEYEERIGIIYGDL